MTLVNSYEDTMGQGHLVLRYELFSCYNHGEYLSHSQDILVDETKKEKKWHFHYHTLLCLAIFHEAFGQLNESCRSRSSGNCVIWLLLK